jgi:phosphoribosylformylglycinamidine synthase
MSSKGGLGIELDLDKVPVRETGMTAYEIMLSESQERMLMILTPQAMDKARAIFEKWELDFAEIGRLTNTGHLVLKKNGKIEADMPVAPLVEKSPVYQRPYVPTKPQAVIDPAAVPAPKDLLAALRTLVGSPDLASRRWVWEQYDHIIGGNTVQRPGGDAAVIRVENGPKGLALTTDVTPRYCEADPFEGGKQAVAECWRNLTAVGARPLAITDNLNFGSPERPEIMGQFVACIRGIGEACRALEFPVVSGNVSLYNETNGRAILPTPSIGGVGVLDDFARSATPAFRREGEAILLVGGDPGWLGQSMYLREICGREEGAPPPVDLAAEKHNGDFVRALIAERAVSAVHDVSDGGVLVAVAEMAIASGIGAALVDVPPPAEAFWFGEDQARYVVTVPAAGTDALIARAKSAGIAAIRLGTTGGNALTLTGERPLAVTRLRDCFESWLPAYMAGGV